MSSAQLNIQLDYMNLTFPNKSRMSNIQNTMEYAIECPHTGYCRTDSMQRSTLYMGIGNLHDRE